MCMCVCVYVCIYIYIYMLGEATEVTLGRGDLSVFVPLGGLCRGPGIVILFLLGGVSPKDPTRDKH